MKRLLLRLTVLLALSGCGNGTAQQEPLASSAPSSVPASASPEMPVAGTTAPTRLRLGTIDAPVVPLELTGSTLRPPDDPSVLGWWGRRAGSSRGATLLVGHTVHDGGGMFDNLEHTPHGASADLNGHYYGVTSVEVISKHELAQRAAALFDQTGHPKLVLVTCEDYDSATGEYASNVVVTLKPVR